MKGMTGNGEMGMRVGMVGGGGVGVSHLGRFVNPRRPGGDIKDGARARGWRREVFDQLYRLLEGEMRVVSTGATPSPVLPLPLDSQTQLVSDLLNVLIGVASTTFPLSQSVQFEVRPGVCVSGTSPESMARLLAELAQYGTHYLRLSHFSRQSAHKRGLVFQGVKLLSYLYNEAQSNCSNENYPVLLSLLKSSSALCRYKAMRIAYLEVKDKHFWQRGSTLISKDVEDSVPVFLRHIANDIYVCGKTINLLKICCPQGGREVFDQLYRLLEGEMRVVSTGATPSPVLPLPLDSQTQLVSDLLNVLIGVASTTFPLSTGRVCSSRCVRACACRARPRRAWRASWPSWRSTATHYLRLSHFSRQSAHKRGLVFQFYKTLRRPSSVRSVPRFVSDWVYNGVLRDVYGEFMIQINEEYLGYRAALCRYKAMRIAYLEVKDKHFWQRGSTLISKDVEDSVPVFLRHIANDIYVCGKTINLLKICCPQHYICGSELPTPRISVTFSLQEVEEIERDCAVYRGRLETIAKHSATSREEQWRNTSRRKEQEEEVDDFGFTRELRDREQRLQALGEQLEQRTRNELIAQYSHLSEDAARRERRALWRVQRMRLDQARGEFLKRDQEMIETMLEKYPLGQERPPPVEFLQLFHRRLRPSSGVVDTNDLTLTRPPLDQEALGEAGSDSSRSLKPRRSPFCLSHPHRREHVPRPGERAQIQPLRAGLQVQLPHRTVHPGGGGGQCPGRTQHSPYGHPSQSAVQLVDGSDATTARGVAPSHSNSTDLPTEQGNTLEAVGNPSEANRELEPVVPEIVLEKPPVLSVDEDTASGCPVEASSEPDGGDLQTKSGSSCSSVSEPLPPTHGHASDAHIKVEVNVSDFIAPLPVPSTHGHASDAHIKYPWARVPTPTSRSGANVSDFVRLLYPFLAPHGHASDAPHQVGANAPRFQSPLYPFLSTHGHASDAHIKVGANVSDFVAPLPVPSTHGHASDAHIKVGANVSDFVAPLPVPSTHGHASDAHIKVSGGLLSEVAAPLPSPGAYGHASDCTLSAGCVVSGVAPVSLPLPGSTHGHSSDSTLGVGCVVSGIAEQKASPLPGSDYGHASDCTLRNGCVVSGGAEPAPGPLPGSAHGHSTDSTLVAGCVVSGVAPVSLPLPGSAHGHSSDSTLAVGCVVSGIAEQKASPLPGSAYGQASDSTLGVGCVVSGTATLPSPLPGSAHGHASDATLGVGCVVSEAEPVPALPVGSSYGHSSDSGLGIGCVVKTPGSPAPLPPGLSPPGEASERDEYLSLLGVRYQTEHYEDYYNRM
ncbi:hypothetical protein CRUP_021014 [Coryphaenoides rupestris]|nr:hypothetical protein CRUP_021014 [Coryphaenoides rupestris]